MSSEQDFLRAFILDRLWIGLIRVSAPSQRFNVLPPIHSSYHRLIPNLDYHKAIRIGCFVKATPGPVAVLPTFTSG